MMPTDLAIQFVDLLDEIKIFKSDLDGTPVPSMWQHFVVRDLTNEDDRARAVRHVLKRVRAMQQVVDRLLAAAHSLDASVYFPDVIAELENARRIFGIEMFLVNQNAIEETITPQMLSSIRMLSGLLRKEKIRCYDSEAVKRVDEIADGLRAALHDVQQNNDDELSPDLQSFLSRSLQEMLDALTQFRSSGVEPVEEALFQSVGEMRFRIVQHLDSDRPLGTIWAKVNSAVSNLGGWITVLTATGFLALGAGPAQTNVSIYGPVNINQAPTIQIVTDDPAP